eukprot:5393174-Alexandrium_andersonii.AAC.1
MPQHPMKTSSAKLSNGQLFSRLRARLKFVMTSTTKVFTHQMTPREACPRAALRQRLWQWTAWSRRQQLRQQPTHPLGPRAS